jgi:protein TonB
MQRLLVHKVEPDSPEGSGPRATGVVVLDAVIASDGTVVALHRLSGPEVLAQAAIDAVRWWRFEPYRVDGKAVDVETDLAVAFE